MLVVLARLWLAVMTTCRATVSWKCAGSSQRTMGSLTRLYQSLVGLSRDIRPHTRD